MKFDASRAAALNKLNNFVEENLAEYSKLRNFDFGPEIKNQCILFISLHYPWSNKRKRNN